MKSLLNDLRDAVRALSHAKGLVASATLALAIGIGSATLMFALVNALLFRGIARLGCVMPPAQAVAALITFVCRPIP